ncbi:MAG: hypothetical protein K0S29_852 [Gammaproteobacteria bacterium]|jgi:hypothetical protein|nr:hypothetical protein [Gammaproteobacteria bacterium]
MGKDYVIVRIWTPKPDYIASQLLANRPKPWGHVSLQTDKGGKCLHKDGKPLSGYGYYPEMGEGYYISLYPSDPKALRSQGVFHSLERDELDLKSHLYDVTVITFDSLDVNKINSLFEKFRESDYDWGILGSSILESDTLKNCVGLTLSLLHHAGVNNKIRRYAYFVAGLLFCTLGMQIADSFKHGKAYVPYGFLSAVVGIEIASQSNYVASRWIALSVAWTTNVLIELSAVGRLYDSLGQISNSGVRQKSYTESILPGLIISCILPLAYSLLPLSKKTFTTPDDTKVYLHDCGGKIILGGTDIHKTYSDYFYANKKVILVTLAILSLPAIEKMKPGIIGKIISPTVGIAFSAILMGPLLIGSTFEKLYDVGSTITGKLFGPR